jgi:hypothetical protein
MGTSDKHPGSSVGHGTTDLEQLARGFKKNMQALVSRLVHRPDELEREMAKLIAAYEQALLEVRMAVERRFNARFNSRPTRPKRPYVERVRPARPKNRGGKQPSAGGVLVKPDKPNNLSGGAAAALEFD